MKLKHFIIVGYLISTTITVVAIIWSVNTMLISKVIFILLLVLAFWLVLQGHWLAFCC